MRSSKLFANSAGLTRLLAKQVVEVSRSVCQDGRIQHLSATGALPRIERPDKIVKFLGKHPAFAFWAVHKKYPP